jgi:hypothetical protein
MISKDKKYRTLGGYEFKIYEIYPIYVHGAYKLPNEDDWKIVCLNESQLIEISPYDYLKIDDKVFVWNSGELKKPRYFAGTNEDGKPMAFDDGRTSFTTAHKVTWSHCEKYEEQNDKT